MSSWIVRGRKIRGNRSKKDQRDQEEFNIELDLSKGVASNIREALSIVCLNNEVSEGKKLGYLNALSKLISETESTDYGYTTEDILCCLRVGLINESGKIRASVFRTVRYLIKKQEDVLSMNKLYYPYLIARSLDINMRNDMERLQALRLVRRALSVAPKHFSPILASCLISLLAGDEKKGEDRACCLFLAILCELGVLNTQLFIAFGGVGALARSVMTRVGPAIVEAAVGVLLMLLNDPETRDNVSLQSFAAPFTELTPTSDRGRQKQKIRLAVGKQALLSILRSFPGIMSFCHPDQPSGFKSICDILYVGQLEARGSVLKLMYHLLGLTLPTWSDEPDVALAALDPSRQRDNWRLSEGFVAAEGRSILKPLNSHTLNLCKVHRALMVYILLDYGVHRALAETIATGDTFISVRAAVLLGALLHLAHTHLPAGVCDLTPPLPKLLENAGVGSQRAIVAVNILGRIQLMMRQQPKPASLFLDRIVQSGNFLKQSPSGKQRTPNKIWTKRDTSNNPLLMDSNVLTFKDSRAWNWSIVRAILRSRDDCLRISSDSDHRLFIKRLVKYFKPSSNGFCRVELYTNTGLAREVTLAGCDLINWLLEVQDPEGTKLLNELISDISEQITDITVQSSAHNCLFSPRHMTTTCCMEYFLFIGQLSRSAKGTVIMKSFKLLEKLEELAIATNHDCYVKLIVSSLDYSLQGTNRKTLKRIISSAIGVQTRQYGIEFLLIILRLRMRDAGQWALKILAEQLNDPSKSVVNTALEILLEASAEPQYLDSLLQQGEVKKFWATSLEKLGDRGYLLKIKFYSLAAGFAELPSPAEELEYWMKPNGYAERYVSLMEVDLHDSLTRRQRDENGNYFRRQSSVPIVQRDVYVLPHLLGQLVQHKEGMQLLTRRNVAQRLFRALQRFRNECDSDSKASGSVLEDVNLVSEESGNDEPSEPNRLETIIDTEVMEPKPSTSKTATGSTRTTPEKNSESGLDIEERILRVKSALWSAGHYGSSPAGAEELKNHRVVEMMTSLAENCQYFSVKATAWYALCLIATTEAGADILSMYDWPCVRQTLGDDLPIVQLKEQDPVPSPVPIQRHHRSLSDGKPELPEPIVRRSRNRSESAATELDTARFIFLDREDTPSPGTSSQRLSQQDADGLAKLRSLIKYREPNFSHTSLEIHSSDGQRSLPSLFELESSSNSTTEASSSTPPAANPREEDPIDTCYVGITLPRMLTMLFPEIRTNNNTRSGTAASNRSDDGQSEEVEDIYENIEYPPGEHSKICLVCTSEKCLWEENTSEPEIEIRREILRYTLRIISPMWKNLGRLRLLMLQQRYPEKFKDPCIFSEVSARIGTSPYRIVTRTFLQELFQDMPFDVLYKESMRILNYPYGNQEIPKRSVAVANVAESSPSNGTLNGRLTMPEVESPLQMNSKLTGESHEASPKKQLPTKIKEKLSDEKIIAEILKPAERLKLSKSSDNKLLKITGTNTAISLE